MRPFRDRVASLMECAFGGRHRVGTVTWFGDDYVTILVPRGPSFATCDDNQLTRLVFAAHDQCVRVEIANGGPWDLKLKCSNRSRDASIANGHLTLEEALAKHRTNGWKEHEEE